MRPAASRVSGSGYALRRSATIVALLAALVMVCLHTSSYGRQGYTAVPVATGLSVPARIGFPPDGSGRIFFLELQTGNIRVIESDTVRAAPWAHLDVATGGERGLLGLAFDPGFAVNGFVYVYYTAAGPTVMNRVVRLTDSGGVAGVTSVTLYEKTVSTPCVTTLYHNAGALACPSPGELYISTGDNRCAQLSGMSNDPRGKILRIDPRIAAPSNAVTGNHWYDDGDPLNGNDDRIFASGLRNPYGMAVDPADLRVYVTENGPDCNDEINRVSNGRDYGWRPECDTGPGHCSCPQDSPWTGPLWSVTPTVSPTGIVVCRGTARYPLPAGTLLFTSYNDGLIRQGVFNGDDSLVVSVFANPGVGSLLDISLGPDSFLYITSNQAVYRIEPVTNDVAVGADPAGEGGLIVFSARGTGTATIRYDADGTGPLLIEVFDITGRAVLRREDHPSGPGTRYQHFPTGAISTGTYFVRVSTAASVQTGKFSVIK